MKDLTLRIRGYGLLSFFLALIHNIFLLYHVDVYVYSYKIDKNSFWLGEVLFLIWNSINDPLFGYLSDSDLVSQDRIGSEIGSEEIISRRLNCIKNYGPLLCVSFVYFWTPILPLGIHFVTGICLYDSFLTVVDLNLNSLLADFGTSVEDRTNFSKARSMGNICASLSVFISYAVWDQKELGPFKIYCLVLAIISCIGLYSVSVILLESLEVALSRAVLPPSDPLRESDWSLCPKSKTSQIYPALSYFAQLCMMPNFVLFIIMSLVQVFHCHFNSSFMPLFMQLLLDNHFPPYFCPMVMGLSFLLPHLNNFYFLQLCERKGTYYVIRSLLVIKLMMALGVMTADLSMLWLIAVFIASNRIFTEGICRLCDLIVADLIDQDYVENEREVSASAFFFGSAAMLTKPGQSFAPIIGTFLLSLASHRQEGIEVLESKAESKSLTMEDFSSYCLVLTGVPIACSIVQLIAWAQFDLKDAKLKFIKSLRHREKLHSV